MIGTRNLTQFFEDLQRKDRKVRKVIEERITRDVSEVIKYYNKGDETGLRAVQAHIKEAKTAADAEETLMAIEHAMNAFSWRKERNIAELSIFAFMVTGLLFEMYKYKEQICFSKELDNQQVQFSYFGGAVGLGIALFKEYKPARDKALHSLHNDAKSSLNAHLAKERESKELVIPPSRPKGK